MRLRDETLRTGRLLTRFDPVDRFQNRSLLFLVSGAGDIEPLRNIEAGCRAHLGKVGLAGFEWFAVPDQAQLATVDPAIQAAKVTRIEVYELAGLEMAALTDLLGPALNRLAAGEAELFPSAGGAVGGPAQGIQLLGRDSEVSSLADLVRGGSDILLLAPRRSGKTSVLRRLELSLAGEIRTVYLDLERDFTPSDVAARLRVLASGERFRLAQQRAEEDWKTVLVESLRELRWPLLLLLDELVYFLQNLETGRRPGPHLETVLDFLNALGDACLQEKARVLVAGSLDFREYLSGVLGIGAPEIPLPWRDLIPFRLPPLSLDSPTAEVRRVLLGTGLVPELGDLEWLVENADLATPYAALQLIDHLAARTRDDGRLGSEDLEAHLQSFLAETAVFRDFDEHLRRKGAEMPGTRRALCDALDLLAEASAGVPEDRARELLDRAAPGHGDRLLAWLVETFPIRNEDGRLVFASRLFQRWWHRQLVGGESLR